MKLERSGASERERERERKGDDRRGAFPKERKRKVVLL